MPAQRIIFWENACKIACIKYEFLSLGFSLEVSKNTKNKKDKIKKNYTCINLSAKEALSYKRKNLDRNIKRQDIKVINLGIRNTHTQIPFTFHC